MGISQDMAQQGPIPMSTDPSVEALGEPTDDGMSSDDLAAALGFATTLNQHMFHGDTEAEGQEGTEKPEQEVAEPKEDMKKELDQFKKDVEQEVTSRLDEIKSMVADALKKDGKGNDTEETT